MHRAIKNLEDAIIEELRDLLSAETQLTKALPKMAKAAQDEELRTIAKSIMDPLIPPEVSSQIINQVNQVMDNNTESAPGDIPVVEDDGQFIEDGKTMVIAGGDQIDDVDSLIDEAMRS